MEGIGRLRYALAGAAALLVLTVASSADRDGVAACPGSGISVYVRADEGDYRCELAKRFVAHAADLSSDAAANVLVELRRPYATRLQLAGTVGLRRESIHLLLDELPETARLINLYEDTRYEVRYLDDTRREFFATNHRNMSAVFHQFDTEYTENTSQYLMFETGDAKFLFWRFKGSAIVELGLVETDAETEFLAALHIFTDSKRYHALFESGLFRYIVRRVVTRIINDIDAAANSLVESGHEASSLTPAFVSGLRSSAQ